MSLRRALGSLPDDRETTSAVREIMGFFDEHRSQPVLGSRVAHVTGMSEARVSRVMAALRDALVIDCDGDPGSDPCRFDPDLVLAIEVQKFLKSAEGSSARLQRGVDRFRSRFDSDTRHP